MGSMVSIINYTRFSCNYCLDIMGIFVMLVNCDSFVFMTNTIFSYR